MEEIDFTSDTFDDIVAKDSRYNARAYALLMDVVRRRAESDLDLLDEFRETTLDPKNRSLVQITMEDASAADDLFRVLMGDSVEPRREFIEQNALEVKNLDV